MINGLRYCGRITEARFLKHLEWLPALEDQNPVGDSSRMKLNRPERAVVQRHSMRSKTGRPAPTSGKSQGVTGVRPRRELEVPVTARVAGVLNDEQVAWEAWQKKTDVTGGSSPGSSSS